jgi:transcription antitermination factor NusG
MFTGYVFVCGLQHQRRAALETNRLAQMLPVADGEQLEADLRLVSSLIHQEVPLIPYERLEPGQSVRIISGPFIGLEGSVVRRENKTFMVVAVQCLQAGALMKVEDFWLEPL